MRYGKAFIGLFTALLILAALVFGINEYAWDGTVGITARITAQGAQEEVRVWQQDRDDYYLFLPSYAELSQVQLFANVTTPVFLNGERMNEGIRCEGLALDVEHDLCYLSRGKEHHYSLTILRSANVPAMYVDTASGTMTEIHETKGTAEPGQLRLYLTDGTLNFSGRLESIKGRGNSTWEFAKKPYNLTLNTDGDLLGMGSAKKWILLANAADETHMRNKLAYDLARDAGLAYTPECQWTDLYLNGEYAGLYLLCERNEVHEQRVNISREGSFLVEKDWQWRFEKSGDPFVLTEAETALQINYSDFSAEELLEILQSAENAILAEDGIDPVTGKHWRELIDVDSWAKKYLIEEILGNVDAGILSQFFYLDGADGSGKIHAGPVWDMDQILRSSSGQWMDGMNRFYANRLRVYGSQWFPTLYRNEEFYQRLTEIYQETFLPLLTKLSQQGLAEYCSQIRQAVTLDEIRWYVPLFDLEYPAMKAYLDERIAFLNRLWVDKQPHVTVMIYDKGAIGRSFAIPLGTCIPALPEYENDETTTYYGWYYWDTDIPFDITQPVWEEMEIQLRYETVETDTQPLPDGEASGEPLSLTSLIPGSAFGGLLGIVCILGLRQIHTDKKKEMTHSK